METGEPKRLWEPDVEDWEHVSAETYRFIIDQGKERLHEAIEESHSITKRVMTILLSYAAALTGTLGYLFSDKSILRHEDGLTILFTCCIAILSIYIFALLFRLIYPNTLFFKGSPPKEIFYKDVFEGLSEEEGLKSLLYNEVIRIQEKIEGIIRSNKQRTRQYVTTLRISLFFVSNALLIIIRTIAT